MPSVAVVTDTTHYIPRELADSLAILWGAFIRSGAALRSYRVLVDEAAEPVASADRSR